ncbi:hypothetical protein RRG08_060084 [Elysia crispata]|uniref:Uncharacterized protein n=1 Tax=Elysia crispata TaxID=231223 RepID=A0AAE1CQI3_9GAST|nr:hypothetical protein RRG08_060084 [Elysia crispata]
MANSELFKAISKLDKDEIKRLLESGKCSINAENLCTDPPLLRCFSLKYRHDGGRNYDATRSEVLKILLNHGADLDVRSWSSPRGKTAAMLAAEGNFPLCLKTLMEYGADLGITSENGNTPLILAAKQGHIRCVELLTAGVSVSTLNHKNHEGQTALIAAASGLDDENLYYLQEDRIEPLLPSQDGNIHCLQQLIEAGADFDMEDKHGCTALMSALKSILDEPVNLLLEKGALVNRVSQTGGTPLSLAHRHMPKLARHGFDPTSSRGDRDCVHAAVSRGHEAGVRTLVINGFPPLDLHCPRLLNCGLSDKLLHLLPTPMSPLAVAIYLRRPHIARYLITNCFFSPYDCTRLCWDRKIRRFLQRHVTSDYRYQAAQATLSLRSGGEITYLQPKLALFLRSGGEITYLQPKLALFLRSGGEITYLQPKLALSLRSGGEITYLHPN